MSVKAARLVANLTGFGQKPHKALGYFLPSKFYLYDQIGKVGDFKFINIERLIP